MDNADLYLNQFLISEHIETMENGTWKIGSFLGYYYIRKCLWSTPANIKTTAASIKKFYKSMLDHGKIQKKDYAILCDEIKADMDEWCRGCAMYNDPDADNPFAPGHHYFY